MKMKLRCVLMLCALFVSSLTASAQARRMTTIAVLDLGDTETGRRIADQFSALLAAQTNIAVVNRAQSRAAARGVGYANSLNLSLEEARDLGAAIGCDFFLTGEAQTLRRTSCARPEYFEAYASLFLVSAHTGKLLEWRLLDGEAATNDEAERILLSQLADAASHASLNITRELSDEKERRAHLNANDVSTFADVPADESAEATHFRPPQPYRRLRPAYTEMAGHFAVTATVDALVSIDAEGEVQDVQITRWAGYGLDESVTTTIRQLHFRPAMRDGVAFPVRVTLRYNFRRPPKEVQK